MLKKIMKLFIKFGIVGISGVIVNMIVYSILIFMNINYLIAATISFFIAVTNNFIWNNIWTFKGKAEHKSFKRKYFSFLLISGINFIVNILVLRLLVENFSINKILSQLIGIGVASTLNFLGNYFIVFKEKNQDYGE
ncbi:GtrA family protein [Haliovirga abyssi]|uniref:Sugar translocase n=1 Tax=Haliovirga abyssi TaxID=2996794 RepID=A0AAU9D4I6_9FUSO|nr:GtrA family protein [Haliovirga abyssi]BDU50921.1 sugar translocase [Haliovirga abyssi]